MSLSRKAKRAIFDAWNSIGGTAEDLEKAVAYWTEQGEKKFWKVLESNKEVAS